MTRTLLVAPTGHGVGLTSACLGMLHALVERGVQVGFCKPLGQPHPLGQVDRSTALVRLTSALLPPEPIPADHVARRLGENALDLLMEDVVAVAERAAAGADVLLVEGLVPGTGLVYSGRVNEAMAQALDADVLLVGTSGGELDAATVAQTTEIAARPFRPGHRDRVLGVLVNRVPEGRRSRDRPAPPRAGVARAGAGRCGPLPEPS